MAMQPMQMDAAGASPRNMQRSQADDPKAWERWNKRFTQAQEARNKEAKDVWQPLYDGLLGSLLRGQGDEDPLNPFSQFCDIVMPHLEGDTREVTARPTRIALGEDPAAKMQMAQLLGDQATALAKSCGFYVDEMGRPGEWIHALWCHMYACGVLLFGFEPPRGLQPVQTEDGETQMIDLDRSRAEGRERADAAMPWVRSYDPRRVLFDGTYNDVARGSWVAIDSFLSVAAAKARWPKYAERWKKTHDSIPAIDCDDEGGDKRGDDEGLIRFRFTYVRDPVRLLVIPDKGAGVSQVIEESELELGIEGLPLLVLGYRWIPERFYPKPAMAEVIGPAHVEIEHASTVRGMVSKVRTITMVQDANLAQQIRTGDDAAVYTPPENLRGMDPKLIVHTMQVGGVPKEHIEIKREARTDFERNTGVADMNLGRREPGDQTATAANERAAAISVRMNGILKPSRIIEAAACQRLVSIAYAKIDWLHGLAMPLGQGQAARFAVFDVNKPVIGEVIDYAFEVSVGDAVTRADEAYAANTAAQSLMSLDPLLQARGQTVAWEILGKTLAEASGLRRGAELIVPLPPPPPPDPTMMQQGMQPGQQPGMEQGMQGPPAETAPEAPPDPAAELEELYAMLEQVGEGTPEEEQILNEIAARTASLEGVAA